MVYDILTKIFLIKNRYKLTLLKKCLFCKSEIKFFFSSISDLKKITLVQCTKCNIVFQNPRLSDDSLDQFYENKYRKNFSSNEYSELFSREQRRGKYIFEFVKKFLLKKGKVLEIGCGTGGILKTFKDKSHYVEGLEIDKNAVNFSKTKGINAKFGDIDLCKKKYDLIILSHVFEHIAYPKEFLLKLKNIVKKGGIVYVEVPGMENPVVKNKNYATQLGHLFYYNERTLSKLFLNFKFRNLKQNNKIQSLFTID